MKVIKKGTTEKGEEIILSENSVWIQKENYKLGRIVKSWKYVVNNVDQTEAEKVFNRRAVCAL